MANASFRDSLNSLGWSRRDADVPVNTSSPSIMGRLQTLNPFGAGGYVRLPTTENPGAPLPAPTRREEEEGWFARKSSFSFQIVARTAECLDVVCLPEATLVRSTSGHHQGMTLLRHRSLFSAPLRYSRPCDCAESTLCAASFAQLGLLLRRSRQFSTIDLSSLCRDIQHITWSRSAAIGRATVTEGSSCVHHLGCRRLAYPLAAIVTLSC